MSRRVLMIAWHYYPSNTSGTHRPAKFAKYLPEFGGHARVVGWPCSGADCPGAIRAALVGRNGTRTGV